MTKNKFLGSLCNLSNSCKKFVVSLGIEPRSWAPETHILSVVLRDPLGNNCDCKSISIFVNPQILCRN
jgi:hypothetical protein